MTQRVAILLAFAMLSSGACHANSFLDGLVGRWKVVTTLRVAKEREVSHSIAQISKLDDGTYYQVLREVGRKRKKSESWVYPDGTSLGLIYDERGRYMGEGRGEWYFSQAGQLIQSSRIESLEGSGEDYSTIRRIGRNKLAEVGSGVLNGIRYRWTATATRIRR